jgi:predicted RNA-binding Zn-ribbon protein involved in translation (DUF1610 family)
VQFNNTVSLDKIVCVRFSCPTCHKQSYIKADKSGQFAQYMQCIHCEQHLSLFTQYINPKLNIHIMSQADIEWLRKIQERQIATGKPLLVYRTSETIK